MMGSSLNQYRIIATIGAGGMGEVFRARDTRLNRDVAVKVLPKDFVADANCLRRFEQEAKTLATLNHPNILTIYDAGLHEGAPYLVSELLEGKTLRDETNGGALPVRKAVEYALQIANGLAAAHGKGIIHRDLKPENIFVTNDGRVKVLDFGLAKLCNPSPALRPPSPLGGERDGVRGESDVPTIRIDAAAIINTTEPGMVLGTPAYMSPEQVRGEPADHRADIFAFGCVLYEMLSGTRAFRRNTPIESMNAVLSDEPPDLSASNANIPLVLERIVQRCLQKQPDNRFQSAKDLAFAIENAGAGSSLKGTAANSTSRSSFRGLLPWTVAALCLAGLLFAIRARKNFPDSTADRNNFKPVRKFDLTIPPPAKKTAAASELFSVISPDGKKIAYANADGLWLRWLDRAAPTLLVPGDNIINPFWSPKSTDLGYFDDRKLYRISIEGGNPMVVATLPEAAVAIAAGGAWFEDRIIFDTGLSELLEAPAQGGKVATALPTERGERDFHNVSALPNGRGVLFVVHRGPVFDTIALWSPGGKRKTLLQIPGTELWRPVFSSSGHVVFHREDEGRGLWAFPFSLEKLERTGEPFRVSDVGVEPSAANDGTLVFSLRGSWIYGPRQLTWVDCSGRITGVVGQPMPGLSEPHIAPDQQRVACVSAELPTAWNVWMFELSSGGAVPITKGEHTEERPHWSNDGQTIFFTRWAEEFPRVFAKSANLAAAEQFLMDGVGEDFSDWANMLS